MNFIRNLLILLLCSTSIIQTAPSIRMPTMPQGLSADKKTDTKKVLVDDGKRHTLGTMTYEELKKAKEENCKKKHFDTAIIYLERMITLCENVNEKAHLIIELGNLHFTQKNYTDAKNRYQEFERLYPGNQLIEHAKKQIILCSKQAILSPDRDQAPTEETLRLAKEYLERKSFTLYREDVEAIKKECESVLAQSECGVTEFYIKQGNFKSAERRIKHIRTEWLDKVPEIGTTLAQLEVNLGAAWTDFEVPKASITLVDASNTRKPTKKSDMTKRF